MDPTLKEINLWRSTKKFWYDEFGSEVFFDKAFNVERQNPQWIGVAVSGIFLGQISNAFMKVYDNREELRDIKILD